MGKLEIYSYAEMEKHTEEQPLEIIQWNGEEPDRAGVSLSAVVGIDWFSCGMQKKN